jgi:hypothetical protein
MGWWLDHAWNPAAVTWLPRETRAHRSSHRFPDSHRESIKGPGGDELQLDARLDPVVRDPGVPLPHGNPERQPGQVRAQAAMDAAVERQVAVGLPVPPRCMRCGAQSGSRSLRYFL